MDVYSLIRKPNIAWRKMQPPTGGCFFTSTYHSITRLVSNTLAWLLPILLLTLFIIGSSEAADANVLFIKSGSASVYDNIIDATQQRIDHICSSSNKKCTKPSISIVSINNSKKLRDLVLGSKWDLIITIGTKAAKQLNDYKIKSPTIYSLIPSHSYSAIRGLSASLKKSAIYIDQPIRRQIQLIKSAMPGKKNVGVLLGSYSGIEKQHLHQIMHNMGLNPIIINVTPNNFRPSLEDIYSKADVLLAQPDPSVYNKKTVLTVLLSSYRHNVPVFGYSAAFVRSGATAAIYSSPTDIGHHIGEEITEFFSSDKRKLSKPAFPKYFSIDTNSKVIRSLNINIPSATAIKAMLAKTR